ncbi:MAG: hypothetical protein WAK31_23360, partial [Chthoniobacterales bacterium]
SCPRMWPLGWNVHPRTQQFDRSVTVLIQRALALTWTGREPEGEDASIARRLDEGATLENLS